MALRAAREKATFRAMPESLSSEENRRADEASGDAAETCFSQFALRLGFFGFALSLLALVFFWIPGAGLALWIFGLALSLFGLARAPRGFGFSGVFVSGVALVFMFVFSGGGEELSERRAAVADASAASAAPRGGKSAAGTADFSAAESGAEAPSDGVPAAEDFSPAEPSASAGTGSAPASGASVAVGGAAASAGTAGGNDAPFGVPPLPVAAFAEISRDPASWPDSVKLSRPRVITLWDEKRKEIMGKMLIPAGTRVKVLAVFPDGALEVLDRTGQKFKLLAADTDFAEAFLVVNPY